MTQRAQELHLGTLATPRQCHNDWDMPPNAESPYGATRVRVSERPILVL